MAELDQKLEEMEGFSEDIREYVVGGKVWSGVSAKWEFKGCPKNGSCWLCLVLMVALATSVHDRPAKARLH